MKKILKLCLVLLLFYVPLKTKAQCDSLVITDIPCDSVIAAINGLSQYTISNTDTPYSVPFAVAYLEICYPEYNADSIDLAALLHCCHPAVINYNDSTLSYCETAIYFRLLLQYALPHRSCLPSWTYNYLIAMLLPQIPVLAADSNISLLCKDVNTCNVNCVSVCDDTIISSCDSINSTAYVYQHILAVEGISMDTNLLVNIYTTLFGYAPPYNTIISQISNCNPSDTAIFTEITYTAANPVYSSDSLGNFYVDFDLLATDTPNNLLFSQGLIYINYDTTTFGSNMVSRGVITATRGIDSFYNLSLSDSTPNLLKLSITHDSTNNLTNLDSIHTNRELCHLKINLTSLSTPAVAAAFDTLAMAGHSMYRQTPTGLEFPYDIIRVDGLVGAVQQTIDTIMYQISFDSITANYVYVGGRNVQDGSDTIIFDIVATSVAGDDVYTAAPAISYNTDAFGTYVFTNNVVSCTTTADDDDYTFTVEDYNSNTFQIHLDANTDNYDEDFFNNSPGVWGVGYQIIATCRLTLGNYCAGVHLSVSPGSTGSYAYPDYSDSTETPTRYEVTLGTGYDTTAVGFGAGPNITGFSPTSIPAGTFDTLTITGAGFGCTQGYIQFPNANDTTGNTFIDIQTGDIILWQDNIIQIYVPSVYNPNITGDLCAGTGYFTVWAVGAPGCRSPAPLTIPYAARTTRLPSGRAVRVGLWGANAGSVTGVTHDEYTFIPDTTVTANPPALATITHAMNDWICETGVRFAMATPVNTILPQNSDDLINAVSFGSLTDTTLLAYTSSTLTTILCQDVLGDTVVFVKDIDITFNDYFFDPNSIHIPWFLEDTAVVPVASAPNIGYYSLYSVARHEFGHAHGLKHVLNTIDRMYPIIQPNTCNDLHYDDVQGALYELLALIPYASGCYTYNPQFRSLPVCSGFANGITDVSGKYNITAYPNPFDQSINIEAEITDGSTVSADMYTLLGQRVYTEQWAAASGSHFERSISTIGLSVGVYLLRISVNGEPFTFKLIKQ